MRRVFISYSRSDAEFARSVSRELEECGFSVFLNLDKIAVGTDYAERIVKEIRECPIVVFILSKKSVEAQWCRREIEYSSQIGKEILIVADKTAALADFGDSWVSNLKTGGFFSWDETERRSSSVFSKPLSLS